MAVLARVARDLCARVVPVIPVPCVWLTCGSVERIWAQALVRGLLCNWLVCAAVWMAAAATSLPGKMLAAYLPVMAFITLGLEHSVANM